MISKNLAQKVLAVILSGLLLCGCTLGQTAAPSFLASASPTFFSPSWETFTPTPSPTATITETATLTLTPAASATPTWAWNPAGNATVPILLYHHISDEAPGSRYYVTVAEFKQQMESLKEWGYTTISISLLVEALKNGAALPPRPIVITFDDGHQSVYDNAFPIMQKLGLTGVVYIVANRLESRDFMDVPELKEMIAAGWEVGAHSMTHADLTLNHKNLRYEIHDSRVTLQDALGVHVDTFAYPYGTIDSVVGQKTVDYGYDAAVGLGRSWQHTPATLFYLSRIEVYGGLEIKNFAALLPWSEPLSN